MKRKVLTLRDIKDPVTLSARESELNRILCNSPEAEAQKIHCALIKELTGMAPWLLPMVMK